MQHSPLGDAAAGDAAGRAAAWLSRERSSPSPTVRAWRRPRSARHSASPRAPLGQWAGAAPLMARRATDRLSAAAAALSHRPAHSRRLELGHAAPSAPPGGHSPTTGVYTDRQSKLLHPGQSCAASKTADSPGQRPISGTESKRQNSCSSITF